MVRAAFGTMGAALQRQRGQLLCWAPVFLGLGIGLYFSLKEEPGTQILLALAGGAIVSFAVAHLARAHVGPLFFAAGLVALGLVLGAVRAHNVGGPVLEFRYYGTIEGRVVAIDRSGSDKPRLTLDRVRLERVSPARTPLRVRVSLHGQEGLPLPQPGAHAMMTGHLSPPPSPAEPRGFDFQRHAWFQQIGAVGYTRAPALSFAAPEPGLALWVFRTRMALSAAIRAALPGEAGAVAAAITVGDRSGMGQDTVENLRRANLAHLLAISGLHMGLLTGFVFGALRFGLALAPPLALAWPTRKIAAIGALLAGAAYLGLSGGAVATERAFVMAAMVFGAVLLDRRALTLRAVALAALVVLTLRPEALLGPGFQMSFAATTALVVAFRWLSERDMLGLPRLLRPVFAVFASSLVAGLATAPFAAAHFNIVSHYGLAANLLSVPVMGAVVMPAAVLAALLAPLGLAAPALWVMERGILWILFVAERVSGLDGAVGRIFAPRPEVLPLLALGAIFLVLWQGRARWSGAAALGLAALLWAGTERPPVLVSPTGGLVGILGAEGRVLSKARGDGFVARSWLENDGDGADQAAAFARGLDEGHGGATGEGLSSVLPIRHITGVKAETARCAGEDILVLNKEPEAAPACTAHTPRSLRDTGALAMSMGPEGLETLTAREVTGRRLWNDRSVRAARSR
ncbi:MAG: ComEC/Rec2 family competence protein [Pseudomonadota bacterium]